MSIILKALKRIQDQKGESSSTRAAAGLRKSPETPVAAVSPAARARMGEKRHADAGAAQARLARARDGQRLPAAQEAGIERHRFGNAPKALLGLIAVLGIFTTGWFVSNIYSNLKLAADAVETGPQADAEQPRQTVSVPQTIPPESRPAAAAPSQTPPPMTDEIIVPAGIATDAAPVSPPNSENIVSVAKPSEPEQTGSGEKEAKPVRKGRPELKINAIAWRANEPKAIVNMQRVYVGDVIEGATVLAIQKKSILMEYDGEPFEVRF